MFDLGAGRYREEERAQRVDRRLISNLSTMLCTASKHATVYVNRAIMVYMHHVLYLHHLSDSLVASESFRGGCEMLWPTIGTDRVRSLKGEVAMVAHPAFACRD